jgi:hypothetical protein
MVELNGQDYYVIFIVMVINVLNFFDVIYCYEIFIFDIKSFLK